MKYQRYNRQVFCDFPSVMLFFVLILVGCAGQIREPAHLCPGKKSVIGSLVVLNSRASGAASFKANGRCTARFFRGDKKRKENFAVSVWFNPPGEFRLHGDVAFNPRGIELGTNEQEFWLGMKPKEIGAGYFWGRWSEASGLGELKMSPKLLLEAFGLIEAGGRQLWSLSNEDGFDILTRRNDEGVVVKKVHIYNCDYRVRKIEYFADDGQGVGVVELDNYTEVDEGFSVPGMVRIVSFGDRGDENSFKITLDTVKAFEFDEKKRAVFFERRQPKGFEHVYRIIGDDFVEEQR